MKTRVSRIAALLLSLLLVMTFVACGGQADDTKKEGTAAGTTAAAEQSSTTATQTEAAPEPVTFTWFGNVGGSSYNFTEGILHNPVFDEITRITGVTIDYTPCIGTTDYTQRLGIILASGEIPDFIEAFDGNSLSKIINAKVVRDDLDELVKQNGPNILKYTKKAVAVSKLLRSDGSGKLYGFTDNVKDYPNYNALYPDGFQVRWDLYKQLGMPKIKTTDDYLKVVADMLKLEPKNKDGKKNYGFGFNLKWAGAHMQLGDYPFERMAGIYFGTFLNNVDIRNDKTFIPRVSADSVFVKEMRFWNKAWQMGLIDPETITMDDAAYKQKLKDCRYVAHATWGGDAAETDSAFIAAGEASKGFAQVIIEDITATDALDMCDINSSGGPRTILITNACKNPERAVKYVDFLCTPEGAVLQTYGIEGQHWDIVNGKGVIKQEVIDGFKNDADYFKKTGLNLNGDWNELAFFSPIGQKIKGDINAGFSIEPDYLMSSMTEVMKDYCKTYGVDLPIDIYKKQAPVIAWDPWACNIMMLPEDLAPKESKITAYLDATVPKAIFQKTDAEFESTLTKMLSDLKAMGWDEVSAYHEKDYASIKEKFDKVMQELGN